MKKIIKTSMLTRYLIKFAIRITVFIVILVMYLTDKASMYRLMTQPVWMGISVIHVLWLGFMVMMITHICLLYTSPSPRD